MDDDPIDNDFDVQEDYAASIDPDQCPECGSVSCNTRGRCWLEDPDVRLGGHDNPYPDEGDDPRIGVDCFETAMWNAYPPAPYDWTN